MAEDLDSVALYGMALGFEIRRRTVLVEGTSDVALFETAARLELGASGIELLGGDLAFVAAGACELLQFVALLSLVNELLTPRQHELHRACKFMADVELSSAK